MNEPKNSKIISKSKHLPILLMVSNDRTRDYLLDLLKENEFYHIMMRNPSELLQALREQNIAIVFVDCEAVTGYGAGIYAKVKVACPSSRVILFGDRAHLRNKSHRDLIKEAMDMGVYACILAPYEEWEVLSMVRHIFTKGNAKHNKITLK